MSFEITQVQVNKTSGTTGKIVAFAKITINNAFCVDGLKVIDGEKGLFVGMPSRKDREGNYKDVAFPISKESRQIITDAVLAKFKNGNDDNDSLF